jgi:tetratricopeptide (TPR) repeat protein
MRAIISLAFLWVAISAPAQARPVCLIAQVVDDRGITDFDVANPLAEALDKAGQVTSVVYSKEDPIYRAAMLDGKVPKPLNKPNEKDLFTVAKTIGATYVIWIDSSVKKIYQQGFESKGVNSKLTLFRGGRKAWEDEQNQITAFSGNVDQFATLKGIATSFANKLALEPWKDLKKQDTAVPQTIGKGQAPIVPDTKDDDPILNDFAAVLDQVKSLVSSNRITAAELLLRDAIDAAPREPARRLALINFLKEYNQTAEAVTVTIAAAAALGDPTLTATAARILLDSGKKAEANQIVNDVIAIAPNHEPVRLLAAELRMREANPAQGLKHLEVVLKTSTSAESYYMRAICRALLGAEDGTRLDLERARKEDLSVVNTLYVRCNTIIDEAMEVEGPDLRSLFQKAVLNRKADEVSDIIDSQERLAKAMIVLLGESSPSVKFDKSHASRVLAFNLLVQTLSELKQYVATGEEDALTEARIDLGEFLRAIAQAKDEFAKERTDASTSKPGRTL